MNVFNKPVQLSKGINLRELLNSENEFHIDMDFKKKSVGAFLNADDDLYPDMGDDNVLKQIEEKTDKMMLASPEYHSFEQLSEKMADCVSGGHVKILIIEEESEGPLIPVDSEVTIHYAAYWEKAKIPFDSSLTMNNGSPLRIRLGRGTFLPGLEIGLTMVRGKTSRFNLLVHPKYAWGEKGVLPRIKPELCLFVVVVYDVKDVQAAVRFNDLPSEEQSKFEVTLRTVKTIRADAKDLFKNRKYKSAIKNYQQAITVLALCHPQIATPVGLLYYCLCIMAVGVSKQYKSAAEIRLSFQYKPSKTTPTISTWCQKKSAYLEIRKEKSSEVQLQATSTNPTDAKWPKQK
ncbi:hypothetical protein K1T71_015092 [Dendrolimus kikuchii]|nr:hypothetical protein K1T71_015092 [Dendrolimus kikuchii]